MRVLDLFCGAGISADGLHLAWPDAEIVGVDKFEQPYYPYTFYQTNAIDFDLGGFDYIWCSPPCQAYSRVKSLTTRITVALIEAMRVRLQAQETPYCIETVSRWPLRAPTELCGSMFGLGVYRHRYFETSYPVIQPIHPGHLTVSAPLGERAAPGQMLYVIGHFSGAEAGRLAMGVERFVPKASLVQAVPPSYSRFMARAFSG